MAHLRVLACLPSLLKACLVLSLAAADHQHGNISLAAAAAEAAAQEEACNRPKNSMYVCMERQPTACGTLDLLLLFCAVANY
jgi:hypothetical protein